MPHHPLRFKPAHDDAFAQDLKAACSDYLSTHHEQRFANGLFFAKAGFLVLLSVCFYVLALQATSLLGFSSLYITCVLSSMCLAMNVFHDTAHRAVFRSASVNRWFGRAIVFPLGIDPDYWTVRHVNYHHAYPNIEGLDLDIEANAFVRQTPFQPYFKHFRFQHLYWPLIAGLSLPYINWVYDWSDRLGKTELARDKVLQGIGGWVTFLGSKIVHLFITLVIPVYVLSAHGIGFGQIVATYFVAQIIASCILVTLILGTHWADTEFYSLNENNELDHTWYAHSFYTTCDWQPKPRAMGYWLGGLNLHLTHHLFPTTHHRHYPALADIVAQVAQKHGFQYQRINYTNLIKAQQTFLKRMGQPPN